MPSRDLPPGNFRVDRTNLRGAPPRVSVDVRSLERELTARVRGEVRFSPGDRALYATDSSNYRQIPLGAVLPRDAEDAAAALAVCRSYGAPIFSRGGGTSLAGQCCNVAVVLDFSKYMNRVLELDPDRRLARVEPGTILDTLREAAAPYGLTFGPDPATHSHCTLGGMIGNDSCGVHSLLAAFAGEGPRTADNVAELDVLLYDGTRLTAKAESDADLALLCREPGRRGEIYSALARLRDRYAPAVRARYPDIPRRVSGYNLPYLLPERGFQLARALVGSEATCVTVLEATVALVPLPAARALLVLGFEDVAAAADHVPELLRHEPIGLEGIDDRLVSDMRAIGLHPASLGLLPGGRGWLLVEFGGASPREAQDRARAVGDALSHRRAVVGGKLFADPAEARRIWRVRESGLGATAHVPGKPITWEGWEDSAVPPERMGDYLRALRPLLERYGYDGVFYGHFGQGCLHTRIDFDLESRSGIAKFHAFLYEAADLVVSFGGSLSGEHGDGQSRAELLPKMFGTELIGAFRDFKRIFDPSGRMNPGKVVDADSVVDNLRLGTGWAPPPLTTRFAYSTDDGRFDRAVLRCVGVGDCRRLSGGTMCPSFMVTREERHSTRGRARLLFEMLRGETITDGWRSDAVREALDLCLACKGCKTDCPVSVDMATYKAEFLSHYYRGRLRPRSAYAMGLIRWWARAASLAPAAVNFATQTPGFASVARALAGIAPERRIPEFAGETFRASFRRERRNAGGPRVLLWPDTFNDHFHPETGRAAAAVLEDAGFSVALPPRPLCCGRPLYDSGMLSLARRQLAAILRALAPEIRAGTPVVVLEPSCASVFRDELVELFPADPNARRLSQQTFLLAELLERRGWRPPRLDRPAILQGHCHQKAVMGLAADEALLRRMGVEARTLDSGCCGMAGAFGFERGDHYAVSMACGERVLLPEVRRASPDTLIVADGFSCREQIAQATGRRALHLAEVLELARVHGPQGPRGIPERAASPPPRPRNGLAALALASAGVATAAAGCALVRKLLAKRS